MIFQDPGDVHLDADRDGNGVGSIVFSTGGTERARIRPDGTGVGFGALLGGSITYVGAPTGDTSGVGDGALIAAAVTAAGANGYIWFQDGTYYAHNLAPLSGQTWDGTGTIKRPTASTSDVIACAGLTNVTINVTLDGNYASLYSTNPGVGVSSNGNLVNITGASSYITVNGRLQNCDGNAVRIYDSSKCKVTGDIYNCLYGVLITSGGSASDPSGVCNYNRVLGSDISYIGKNAIFITGHSDSTSLPNLLYGHKIVGVTITNYGDTGIELGQGSRDCVVSNVHIDGGNYAFNGILFRDCQGHSLSNFTIKDVPSFTNGNGADITLGNGLYYWPQWTGVIKDISVANGVIENCSRGVFAQGNNTTFTSDDNINGGAGSVLITDAATTNGSPTLTSATADFTAADAGKSITGSGIPGATTILTVTNATTVTLSANASATASNVAVTIVARTIYAGCSLTNVVVKGTQTGILTGGYASFLDALRAHGFYIQSVTGFDFSRCTARDCQNNGFQIGDSGQGSSYVTEITLNNCRAIDNGKQARGGITYYGFRIAGTASQANVRLNNCRAHDTHVSGARYQHYGYSWNGSGTGSGSMSANAALTDCTGTGNATGLYDSIGNDMRALGGDVVSSATSITVGANASVAIFTSGAGAGQTFTLQSAVLVGAGHKVLVRNLSANALTIARNGSATLSTTSLAAGAERTFVSDGSANWF